MIKNSHNNLYPSVTFSYDIQKDIDNINIGLETVRRGRKADQELESIILLLGKKPARREIETYLKKRWNKTYIKNKIKETQKLWNEINDMFFKNIKEKMLIDNYPKNYIKINGFFSSRYGSGYNYKKGWFAVSLHQNENNNLRTAMHEIMHIIFHYYYWKECKKTKIQEKNIWDVKEAMTVLLNAWFKDTFKENLDLGYQEHTELRRKIIKLWWPKEKNFKKIVSLACEFMSNNPNKSSNWS